MTQGGKLTQQLSFARNQPFSPVLIDVPQLISNSAVLLLTSVGEIVDLTIIIDKHVWNTRADPVQLEAVILNLIVNTRVAMSQGGPLLLKISNATLNQEYADANKDWEIWLPEGPEQADLRLIRFTPATGEYWDLSGGKGLKFL